MAKTVSKRGVKKYMFSAIGIVGDAGGELSMNPNTAKPI